MIKASFLSLLILLAVSANAGSFVVNEVLYTSSHQDVLDYLKMRGYKTFVLSCPEYPQITIIAEEQSDSQSDEAIEALLRDTSSRFKTVALANLIHDSDVIYNVGFQSGVKVFSYVSNPGYFDGTEKVPACDGLSELATLIGMDGKAFSSFLQKEKVESYTFADDLLADMLEVENLPKWIAGISFTYLKEDQEMVQWCEENGIVVKRIE